MLLAGVGHPKENEPADPDSYRREADAEFVDDVSRRLVRRFPGLAGAEVVSNWAGLYTITPDWNMLVGAVTRRRRPLPRGRRKRALLQARPGDRQVPRRDSLSKATSTTVDITRAEAGPFRRPARHCSRPMGETGRRAIHIPEVGNRAGCHLLAGPNLAAVW